MTREQFKIWMRDNRHYKRCANNRRDGANVTIHYLGLRYCSGPDLPPPNIGILRTDQTQAARASRMHAWLSEGMYLARSCRIAIERHGWRRAVLHQRLLRLDFGNARLP